MTQLTKTGMKMKIYILLKIMKIITSYILIKKK